MAGVKINTDVMKQYNPDYKPTEGAGVSGVQGTQASGQGGLSNTNAQVLKDQYAKARSEGATHEQAQGYIKGKLQQGGVFDKVQQQYNNADSRDAYASAPVEAGTGPTAFDSSTHVPKGMWKDASGTFHQGEQPPVVPPTPPETPKTEPTTPVTTPQATTTPKTTSNVATTQKTPAEMTTERQATKDLIANALKNNPELFNNYENLKNAVGYDNLDPETKKSVDAVYQAKTGALGTQEGIFKSLTMGQEVTNPDILKTPAYKEAKARADVVKKYKGASSDVIYNAMNSGFLDSAGQAWADMIQSNGGIESQEMTMAKQKMETKKKIDSINSNASITGGGEVKEDNKMQNISNAVTKGMTETTAQAFQRLLIDNPEVKKRVDSLLETQKQLLEKKRAKSNIIADIRKKHPDMSLGAVSLLAKSQTEGIDRDIEQLQDDQSLQGADLKYYTDISKSQFDIIEEENKDLREFVQSKDFETFKAKLGVDTKQAEFLQSMKQKALVQSTPELAIQDLIDQYIKLGVPFETSVQSHIAQANEFIKQGGTLAGYLDKMMKDINLKPEYKAIIKEKAGLSPVWQEWEDSEGNKQAGWVTPGVTPGGTITTPTTTNGILSVLGNGKITGYGGEYDGFKGLDIDGKKGDPVYGFGGKVVSIIDANFASSPFGNSVVVEDEEGNQIRLSHLDSINVKPGQTISNTDVIGVLGNTGNVKPGKGGDGSHLDVRVKKAGQETEMSSKGVEQFLKGYGQQKQEFAPGKIDNFNSLTATQKAKMVKNPEYMAFQEAKDKVMTDENASIFDVMKYSKGGKDIGEERVKSLGKFNQSLSQISDLTEKIKTEETGPIIGRLRSYNPYDANAQALLAEINSIIPNIARGVYGEVGVLTDNDVQNYAKTLPNIKSTEDTNKLVLAMTLKTMLNGFKGQIQIDGAAGRDVSGYGGVVKQYETKINNILSEIGKGKGEAKNEVDEFDSIYNDLNKQP